MSSIVSKQLHFDNSEENTSDEEKYVLKKFNPSERGPMSKPDILAALGLKPISKTTTFKPAPPPPVAPKVPSLDVDDFTHFIRHTLALQIFGDNVPTDPPKSTDPPDLVADLTLFHHAAAGSKRFREAEFAPHISKLFAFVQTMIPTENAPLRTFHTNMLNHAELTSQPSKEHVSSWTMTTCGDLLHLSLPGAGASVHVQKTEADLLRALHNVYHLQAYVCAVVKKHVDESSIVGLTYVQTWETVSKHNVDLSIREWDEFTFIEFIDSILNLYKVWCFTKNDIIL